jgi:hypothetical protein
MHFNLESCAGLYREHQQRRKKRGLDKIHFGIENPVHFKTFNSPLFDKKQKLRVPFFLNVFQAIMAVHKHVVNYFVEERSI